MKSSFRTRSWQRTCGRACCPHLNAGTCSQLRRSWAAGSGRGSGVLRLQRIQPSSQPFLQPVSATHAGIAVCAARFRLHSGTSSSLPASRCAAARDWALVHELHMQPDPGCQQESQARHVSSALRIFAVLSFDACMCLQPTAERPLPADGEELPEASTSGRHAAHRFVLLHASTSQIFKCLQPSAALSGGGVPAGTRTTMRRRSGRQMQR